MFALSLFQKTYSRCSFCALYALTCTTAHDSLPDRFAPEKFWAEHDFCLFSNLRGNYHFMRHGRLLLLLATGKFLCTPENTHFIFAVRPKRCNQLLFAQLTSFLNFLPAGFYREKVPQHCLSFCVRLWREFRLMAAATKAHRSAAVNPSLKFFCEIVRRGT